MGIFNSGMKLHLKGLVTGFKTARRSAESNHFF